MVGDRLLERFRIDEVFTGGMGLLSLVTDVNNGRRYAIKTVRPDLRADARVVKEFLREARTSIALDQHPHLVQALWLAEEPEPLLVLEYVSGRNVEALLADGPLPVARAVDLAMQCVTGLHYAHTKPLADGVGIVHRDIKPANLLVTDEDRLKISDFGLARVFGGGRAAGTPFYAAPEQLRGGDVDGRADLYSLGLVLYEMLTGRNPLAGGDLRRVLEETPPPLEDVPPALSALVAGAVAKDPAGRPADAREMLAHLAQVARELDHDWTIDPASIAPPAKSAGIVLSRPRLFPRRPRAGESFVAELEVRGDIGRGPVELAWSLSPADCVELLTPKGTTRLRVEAGGNVEVTLRHRLFASSESGCTFDESRLVVTGPEGDRIVHRVPPFLAEIAYAFVLPLTGRNAERERLRARIAETALGGGGILLISGEMGMGRTRLLREAERLVSAAGLRTVATRAQRSGLRPMRILNDVARQLLDGGLGVRAAVHDLLGDDPPTSRYFSELLSGGTSLEGDAPVAARWYALVAAAARREPVVLLLDDLHLADEQAARVILDVAVRARGDGLPLLVIGTICTDDSDPAVARRLDALESMDVEFEPMQLEPLDDVALTRLVGQSFPGHGFAEEAPWLVPALQRITRGNPFHLTELLRALRVGEGLVPRVDGEWRLAADLSPERLRQLVPEAIDAVVRARADALSLDAREVADCAAFIGEEFDGALLKAVHSILRGRGAPDKGLEELEAADVLRMVDPDRDRYRFWSAVAPTVLCRVVEKEDPERNRRLHLAVADGILATYAGEGRIRRSLAVAHHLRVAGEADRSLPFTLAGCARLLTMQLSERARRLLANARPLANRADPATRARLHYLYGLACESTGEYAEARDALVSFLEADGAGDARAVPRAQLRLGRVHQALGEYAAAAASFAEAQRRFEENGDRRKLAFVHASLTALALERGELLRAGEHLETATRLAHETGNEGAAIQALNLRGALNLRLDRVPEAWRAFGEAEKRSSGLGEHRRHAAALEGLGRVALRDGYLRQAEATLERAIDERSRIGDRPGLAGALLHLADIYRAEGRTAHALRHYRRAQRVFDESGHRDGVATARHRLGVMLGAWGKTTHSIRELAAAAEEFGRLRLPERHAALRDLGKALVDAGSARPARIALARADRGEAPGPSRRARRVESRTVRSRLALSSGDLARARVWAKRALHHARRTTGHAARIAANLALGEADLRSGELHGARLAAETALAFAREEGTPMAAAAAERILLELAGPAGRHQEARERAHRAARAYTGRGDAGAGPAYLLLALARAGGPRAERFRRAARRCFGRLASNGFASPEGL